MVPPRPRTLRRAVRAALAARTLQSQGLAERRRVGDRPGMPASLSALLAGFDVHADYPHLRELCQTDVDGASIDTLEELAIELGLDAQQTIIPADHLFLDEARALPALVVVRLPRPGSVDSSRVAPAAASGLVSPSRRTPRRARDEGC